MTSDNSHYSIVKELFLLLSTKLSKLQQSKLGLLLLDCSSYDKSSISIPQSQISNSGGGEGIRTPDPRVANAVLCQLSYAPNKIRISKFEIPRGWLRGRDLNPRPLGYEPNELPDCSTPRHGQTPRITHFNIMRRKNNFNSEIENPKSEIRWWAWVESNYRPHAYQACALTN